MPETEGIKHESFSPGFKIFSSLQDYAIKLSTPAKVKRINEEWTKCCLQSYRLQLFMLQKLLSKTGLS